MRWEAKKLHPQWQVLNADKTESGGQEVAGVQPQNL